MTPPLGVHTKDVYTPLYTESQSTGHLDRTVAYTTQAQVTQPEGVAAKPTEAELTITTTEAAAQAI